MWWLQVVHLSALGKSIYFMNFLVAACLMTCTLAWLSVRNQLIKFNLILLNSDIVFWSMIFLIGCLLLHRINYGYESQPVQSNLKNIKILSVQLFCTVQQYLVIFCKSVWVFLAKKTTKKKKMLITLLMSIIGKYIKMF